MTSCDSWGESSDWRVAEGRLCGNSRGRERAPGPAVAEMRDVRVEEHRPNSTPGTGVTCGPAWVCAAGTGMRPLGSKSPMCLGTVTLIRYQLKGAAGLGGGR